MPETALDSEDAVQKCSGALVKFGEGSRGLWELRGIALHLEGYLLPYTSDAGIAVASISPGRCTTQVSTRQRGKV